MSSTSGVHSSQSSFAILPMEMAVNVFAHLSPRELMVLRKVCNYWNCIVMQTDSLWDPWLKDSRPSEKNNGTRYRCYQNRRKEYVNVTRVIKSVLFKTKNELERLQKEATKTVSEIEQFLLRGEIPENFRVSKETLETHMRQNKKEIAQVKKEINAVVSSLKKIELFSSETQSWLYGHLENVARGLSRGHKASEKEIVFFLAAISGEVSVLKDLVAMEKAIFPTQSIEEVKKACEESFMIDVLKKTNFKMLRYLLEQPGVILRKRDVSCAIELLRADKLGILLKAGAPLSGFHFLQAFEKCYRFKKQDALDRTRFRHRTRAKTSFNIKINKIFETLCLACTQRKAEPEKWKEYKTAVLRQIKRKEEQKLSEVNQLKEEEELRVVEADREVQQKLIESYLDYAKILEGAGLI